MLWNSSKTLPIFCSCLCEENLNEDIIGNLRRQVDHEADTNFLNVCVAFGPWITNDTGQKLHTWFSHFTNMHDINFDSDSLDTHWNRFFLGLYAVIEIHIRIVDSLRARKRSSDKVTSLDGLTVDIYQLYPHGRIRGQGKRTVRSGTSTNVPTCTSVLEVPEQSLLAQFFFRLHDLVFFFLLHRDFFLQFSLIYLSISKLLQFSLNFFYLLQFTSCSKFLSPIFFSLPTLTWHLILSRRTWRTVLIHHVS